MSYIGYTPQKKLKKLFVCDLGLNKQNSDYFVDLLTDLRKKIIGGYYPINHEIGDLDILRQFEKKKINHTVIQFLENLYDSGTVNIIASDGQLSVSISFNIIVSALNVFIIVYAYSLSFFPKKWRKKVDQDTLVGLALIFSTMLTMFSWIIYFYLKIF